MRAWNLKDPLILATIPTKSVEGVLVNAHRLLLS